MPGETSEFKMEQQQQNSTTGLIVYTTIVLSPFLVIATLSALLSPSTPVYQTRITRPTPEDLNGDGTRDIIYETKGKKTPLYALPEQPETYITAQDMMRTHPETLAEYETIEKRVNEIRARKTR